MMGSVLSMQLMFERVPHVQRCIPSGTGERSKTVAGETLQNAADVENKGHKTGFLFNLFT